jgi:elongator complex protein 4
MASFRRRGVAVKSSGTEGQSEAKSDRQELAQGVRQSPLDGRLTTSTGTRSLDTLLAGHAGLALGTSLLVEESGTTDFGGSLLRYYASEGVVQRHHVHVLGMNEAWGRDLPGLVEAVSRKTVLIDSVNEPASSGTILGSERTVSRVIDANADPVGDCGGGGVGQKMKIAWRYERLGEFGPKSTFSSSVERSALIARTKCGSNWCYHEDHMLIQPTGQSTSSSGAVFCHDFDLSTRLTLLSPSLVYFVPSATRRDFEFREKTTSPSPLNTFLDHLIKHLSTSPSTALHRVVIPNLLSPALYPSDVCRPESILQFLHALRALLRKYSTQLTAMITLPLTLYPRSTGLTRWMELLSDGVLELAPFPSTSIALKITPGSSTVLEEPPQGMVKIHRLPIFHEKGGGGGEASGFGDDLAFTLSRRKGLVIRPFSLPPVEGDSEAQQGGLGHDHGKATKVDIEF